MSIRLVLDTDSEMPYSLRSVRNSAAALARAFLAFSSARRRSQTALVLYVLELWRAVQASN